MPNAIPAKPASRNTIPAIKSAINIYFYLTCAGMSRSRRATVPSYWVHRQPAMAA
jgi:hypothetical protein